MCLVTHRGGGLRAQHTCASIEGHPTAREVVASNRSVTSGMHANWASVIQGSLPHVNPAGELLTWIYCLVISALHKRC